MDGWSAGLVRRLRPGRPHGRSPWRLGVPVVCLLAGLLLAATHGVSGGGEIRRSDAPRLVDLVRAEEASVDRLSAERDALGQPHRLHTRPVHQWCAGGDAQAGSGTQRRRRRALRCTDRAWW